MSFVLAGILFAAIAGLPIFLVLSVLALNGFISNDLISTLYFAEVIRLAENPTLVAIPLFTFAGYLLAESNASSRMVSLANRLLGWLPGGLAIVALSSMAMFTAFSGASGVTIIALGGLMMPALLKKGHDEKFSLGLLTVSGSVGLLFPPSLPLIIYAVIAETPVTQMFIGGVLPGILMVCAISIYCVRKGYSISNLKVEERNVTWHSFSQVLWEAPLPIVIIVGIFSGLITVVDAAIVTVVYLIVIECFIIKDISFTKDLPRILRESSVLIGGILLIIGSALALTNYIVFADIPSIALGWIQSIATSPIGFLLILNIFLLIIGFLMDVFSALMVVVPIILPIALEYGIHPVHLGIIFLTNLEIGYNTPPVGLNLFISSFRFNKPVLKVYRSTLPFLAIQLIVLLIITYFPLFTLYPLNLFAK